MDEERYRVDINYHEYLGKKRKKKQDSAQLYVPSVNVTLEDLDGQSELPERFYTDMGSAHFECFFKRNTTDWLFVVLTAAWYGAELPRFQRWSWHPIMEANALYIEDPMYYNHPGLKYGWFVGTEEEDYSEYVSTIVKKIAKKLKVPPEHIVFYGFSSGGTAAINCANCVENSVSMSVNPQFFPDPGENRRENFEKSTKISFDNPKIAKRINPLDKIINNKSKNIIIVNCASKGDFSRLLEWCDRLETSPKLGLVRKDNTVIWTYDAHGIPYAHNTWEDRPMFKAMCCLAKAVAECKTDADLEMAMCVHEKLFEAFTDLWYERYSRLRNSELERTKFLLASMDPFSVNEAIKTCKSYAKYGDNVFVEKSARAFLGDKSIKKDVDKAIKLMRMAADVSVECKHELFDLLWKRGSEDDLKEAFEIASEFSSEGNVMATGKLARAYRDGKGVEKDIDKAIELMRIAAEEGEFRWARHELFVILWKRGSEDDLKEAFEIASKFSSKGDSTATGHLALAYRHGKGVEKDIDKAIELMRIAANANIGWAKKDVIDMLIKRDSDGDIQEAVTVCSLFASSGNADAMGRLSRMYHQGIGVTKDAEKAIEWMKKAAEKKVTWKKEFEKMLAEYSRKVQ